MSRSRTIVVLGLDNSHPYVDVRNLAQLDPTLRFVLVGAARPAQRERFLQQFPDTDEADDLATVLAEEPAGVLVTLRPSRLIEELPLLASTPVPAFINKQAVATSVQLHRVHSILHDNRSHRLMTSSVLRYAAGVEPVEIDHEELFEIDVFVGHGISHWADPGNEWQAAVDEGGALVGALSYHGFELLDAIVGGAVTVDEVSVTAKAAGFNEKARIHGHGARGWKYSIELNTTGLEERYWIRLTTATGTHTVHLDGARDDGFGYRAAMAAFLRHVSGETPLAWEHSLAIIESSVRAHTLAHAL